MQCFIVVFQETKGVDEIREAGFAADFRLTEKTWLIASKAPLLDDVCRQLGMGEEKQVGGIVVPVENYRGFYNPAVWDWLRYWRSQ